MSIDIEALRAKLDKMNNRGKPTTGQMKSDLWVPDYGQYIVRPIPWPDSAGAKDSAPFLERWFYYGLGKRVIAPSLTSPDPIRELRNSLFQDRTPMNLETAKQLKPKMRCFLPIIIDIDGVKEVKFWGMSPTVYKSLLNFVVDPDYGDVSDPDEGFDIKVSITDSGKKFPDGTVIRDVQVQPKPKSRKLTKEERDLISTMPDINAIYPVSSYDELAEALNKFVNSTTGGGGETRRGGSAAASGHESAQSAGTKPQTGNLDSAFDDLLGD